MAEETKKTAAEPAAETGSPYSETGSRYYKEASAHTEAGLLRSEAETSVVEAGSPYSETGSRYYKEASAHTEAGSLRTEAETSVAETEPPRTEAAQAAPLYSKAVEEGAFAAAGVDSAEEACEHALLAERARRGMPAEEQIESMCAAFKVLGEPSRMKILLALLGGELCVYHIAEAVGGNQSNVSHQLRILKDARIVRSRRAGKNILYSVADEHVTAIVLMSRAHAECR